MTGQPNRAERFLAHVALGIADRLMIEVRPLEAITKKQNPQLGTQVRRWVKSSGRVRDMELVIVGTKIPPHLLFMGSLQDDCSEWLSDSHEFFPGDQPFMTIARSNDGGRLLRLLANCFICAEVLMILAHRGQFEGENAAYLKELYDEYHARNGSEDGE